MAQQLIPLTTEPNQQINITLSVDGAPLSLILLINYNEIAKYWVMTVYDANGNLILSDVPLVTGNYPACNILAQYAYLEIGSAYVLNLTGTSGVNYPDDTNLGTDFVLVWGDTP
jgi:hypothetical protein